MKALFAKVGHVTRTITRAECFWLGKTVKKGTEVVEYLGATYGCITPSGIAVRLPNDSAFTELPVDAIEWTGRKEWTG